VSVEKAASKGVPVGETFVHLEAVVIVAFAALVEVVWSVLEDDKDIVDVFVRRLWTMSWSAFSLKGDREESTLRTRIASCDPKINQNRDNILPSTLQKRWEHVLPFQRDPQHFIRFSDSGSVAANG
jgi:hypothetical protein